MATPVAVVETEVVVAPEEPVGGNDSPTQAEQSKKWRWLRSRKVSGNGEKSRKPPGSFKTLTGPTRVKAGYVYTACTFRAWGNNNLRFVLRNASSILRGASEFTTREVHRCLP